MGLLLSLLRSCSPPLTRTDAAIAARENRAGIPDYDTPCSTRAADAEKRLIRAGLLTGPRESGIRRGQDGPGAADGDAVAGIDADHAVEAIALW